MTTGMIPYETHVRSLDDGDVPGIVDVSDFDKLLSEEEKVGTADEGAGRFGFPADVGASVERNAFVGDPDGTGFVDEDIGGAVYPMEAYSEANEEVAVSHR
jgi:hypothetical protein